MQERLDEERSARVHDLVRDTVAELSERDVVTEEAVLALVEATAFLIGRIECPEHRNNVARSSRVALRNCLKIALDLATKENAGETARPGHLRLVQ
jgi:hypothetical protein